MWAARSVIVICASGKAPTIIARRSSSRIPMTLASVLAVDELAARFGGLVVQRGPDFGVADLDPRRGQVARELAHDVLVTRFLEIGLHNRLDISVGFLVRTPHLPAHPSPDEPFAARGGPDP